MHPPLLFHTLITLPYPLCTPVSCYAGLYTLSGELLDLLPSLSESLYLPGEVSLLSKDILQCRTTPPLTISCDNNHGPKVLTTNIVEDLSSQVAQPVLSRLTGQDSIIYLDEVSILSVFTLQSR